MKRRDRSEYVKNLLARQKGKKKSKRPASKPKGRPQGRLTR